MGNTSVDACLYDKTLEYLGKFPHGRLPDITADVVLVSSVRPSLNPVIKEKYPNAKFIKPEHVPLETAFEGKERVGIDRLLNLFGATRFYSENVAVASFGTAFVVDLAIDGVFQGGFILIGIGSGLECISQKAELIPRLEPKKVYATIGTNTESAILGGFIKQSFYFLKGCLTEWQELYGKSLKLVITGGDGWIFEELGTYDPYLIHRAMVYLYTSLQTL